MILSNTQLCSFYKMEENTISHLFNYCTDDLQDISNQVQAYFTDCLHFSQSSPQTAPFGFHSIDNDSFLLQNHIIFLLRRHICNTRKYRFLSFNNFLIFYLDKIKNSERRVTVIIGTNAKDSERNGIE